MLFTSSIFLFLFLPFVLFIYYGILRKTGPRNTFLTFASLFFYAWGTPDFFFLLLLSILANWIFGILVEICRKDRIKSKLMLGMMLAFNFSLIFVFKYLVFTVKSINSLIGSPIIVPQIALPIGISFFTFHAVSYVIDIYRGKADALRNPLTLCLYISFFPQLIAGPIIRYRTIAAQIRHRQENFRDFSQGVCRFIIGLSKKLILANTFALIADKAFSLGSDDLSLAFAWLGAIAYTLQIYFDFSGYSDMAIGLAKMFGFHFPENFHYPYIASSVSDFWRRWHISLGSWFRDYVYFPLGGSHVDSKMRLIFNLLVVWLFTGIWHGANWTFIVWGLYYFLLIAGEKLIGFPQLVPSRLRFLPNISTLFFVILGWVLFRSADITQAVSYIGSMFGLHGNKILDDYALFYLTENCYSLLVGILCCTPLAKWTASKLDRSSSKINLCFTLLYVLLFAVSLSYLVKGAYNPFIYFNF